MTLIGKTRPFTAEDAKDAEKEEPFAADQERDRVIARDLVIR